MKKPGFLEKPGFWDTEVAFYSSMLGETGKKRLG